MAEAISIITLLTDHFRLSSSQYPNSQEDENEMSRIPYARSVKSLMYAMVCIRLDLAYAASTVSRFMSNLGRQQHWETIKWCLGVYEELLN